MPLTTRERRLNYWLARYEVDPDYGPCGDVDRYLVIATAFVDGESNAAACVHTLAAARNWLAPDPYDDYMRQPALVVDLDTGHKYEPSVQTRVTLTRR